MNDFLPKNCPVCKTRLIWTHNKKTNKKVDLYCPNLKCTGPDLNQIVHFFKVLSADFLQEGTIKSLIDSGLNTIPKILAADKSQLRKADGFADVKTAKVLLSLIKTAENMSLAKLAHASGVFSSPTTSIGETLIEPIFNFLGRKFILDSSMLPEKIKLLQLPNIGSERAELFIKQLPEFRIFYKTLKNITLAPEGKVGKLTGQIYCFTGFRDAEMHKDIEQNGGRVTNNLTKQTNVLFAAAPSTKTTQAEKYNIKIVMQHEAKKYLEKLLK